MHNFTSLKIDMVQLTQFSQDHFSERKLYFICQKGIISGVALFWDLPALPCAYMASLRQGARQQIRPGAEQSITDNRNDIVKSEQ